MKVDSSRALAAAAAAAAASRAGPALGHGTACSSWPMFPFSIIRPFGSSSAVESFYRHSAQTNAIALHRPLGLVIELRVSHSRWLVSRRPGSQGLVAQLSKIVSSSCL